MTCFPTLFLFFDDTERGSGGGGRVVPNVHALISFHVHGAVYIYPKLRFYPAGRGGWRFPSRSWAGTREDGGLTEVPRTDDELFGDKEDFAFKPKESPDMTVHERKRTVSDHGIGELALVIRDEVPVVGREIAIPQERCPGVTLGSRRNAGLQGQGRRTGARAHANIGLR